MLILSKKSLDKKIQMEVKTLIDSGELYKQRGKGSLSVGQMPSILAGSGYLVYNEENITLETMKLMENDGGIVAPLTIIKAPIKSIEWEIKSESAEVKDFVKKALKLIWGQFIDELLYALNFGFQSFEKVFVRNNDGIVYKKLLAFDPVSITAKADDFGDFAGIELSQPLEKIQLPPEKCFHYVNDMRWSNFYGKSIFRPAYPYWFNDKYMYEFENVFMEKLAYGVLLGYAPSGKTTVDGVEYDNVDTMNSIAKDVRSGGVASLPSEMWSTGEKSRKWAFEILETKKDNKQFINTHVHLDTMKARALFVPDLVFASGKGVGSYALGKEHSNIFILSIEGRVMNIKQFIDKFLIPQLVEYNFGANAPRAEWVYETLSTTTIGFLRDLFLEMTKQGRSPDLDWEFVFSALGVPVPSQLKKDGGVVKPKTEPEEEEDEGGKISQEKKHKHKTNLEIDGGNVWANRIDLAKLERKWDGIDDKIRAYMEDFIGQSKDGILLQYEKMMERGRIIANEIKIRGVTNYKVKLKQYMTDSVRIGMESAKDELKTDQNFSISPRMRNWIDTKVNNTVNKQLEDLRYQLGMGIEDTLQANLAPTSYDKTTIKEAIGKATENYDTWVKFTLTISSRSLTSHGINQGRSTVAENVK